METKYIVICLDTNRVAGVEVYTLATRRVFNYRQSAERYAAGVAVSRMPLVVEGDFAHLRQSLEDPPEHDTSPLIRRVRALRECGVPFKEAVEWARSAEADPRLRAAQDGAIRLSRMQYKSVNINESS